MCLAIPAKITKITKNIAEVETMGVKKDVDITLVPEVKTGDYVIVHAGFAIQAVEEKEALEARGYWKEFLEQAE
jgi:hydrogenase expression/formation protein HypC